jgi:excisionase family DNA binding protein
MPQELTSAASRLADAGPRSDYPPSRDPWWPDQVAPIVRRLAEHGRLTFLEICQWFSQEQRSAEQRERQGDPRSFLREALVWGEAKGLIERRKDGVGKIYYCAAGGGRMGKPEPPGPASPVQRALSLPARAEAPPAAAQGPVKDPPGESPGPAEKRPRPPLGVDWKAKIAERALRSVPPKEEPMPKADQMEIAEAADILGCTPPNVHRLIRTGQLRAAKEGRRTLLARAQVASLAERRKEAGDAPVAPAKRPPKTRRAKPAPARRAKTPRRQRHAPESVADAFTEKAPLLAECLENGILTAEAFVEAVARLVGAKAPYKG